MKGVTYGMAVRELAELNGVELGEKQIQKNYVEVGREEGYNTGGGKFLFNKADKLEFDGEYHEQS